MFDSKTRVEHINFRYDGGVCIVKYMDNNTYHSIDICLWDKFDSSRQITIHSNSAKLFYNQIKLEENQNLRALERLIREHLIT